MSTERLSEEQIAALEHLSALDTERRTKGLTHYTDEQAELEQAELEWLALDLLPSLLAEVRASRSSPGSGDEGRTVREALALLMEAAAWVNREIDDSPAARALAAGIDAAERALSSPVSVPAPGDGALREALETIAKAVGKRATFHWDHGFGVITGEVYNPEALAKALDPKALRRALDASPALAPGTRPTAP